MKKGETDAFSFAVGKKELRDISKDSIAYGNENGALFGFKFPNMSKEGIQMQEMEEVTIQVYQS